MIKDAVYRRTGTEARMPLPMFAWPGGYPFVYLCQDGEDVCPKCVNDVIDFRQQDDPQWNVTDAYVHWEGPPIECANCHCKIDSAYGDPEEGEVAK